MNIPDMREWFKDIKLRLSELSPKERRVLFLRNGLADGVYHTLEEVGKDMGVTRERIRQIEAKAEERIRLTYNTLHDVHSHVAKGLTDK